MAAKDQTPVVVTDANVLINLIHVGRLDLLGVLADYAFVVPVEVVAEVSVPEHAGALRTAFDAGHIEQVTFTDTTELELYAELVEVLGSGESACLAMAQVRGWCVASDERRKFLRLATERLGEGRILNTPGILVLAIRAGLVTVEQADGYKVVLEGQRFKMRFTSFREVLGTPREEEE